MDGILTGMPQLGNDHGINAGVLQDDILPVDGVMLDLDFQAVIDFDLGSPDIFEEPNNLTN